MSMMRHSANWQNIWDDRILEIAEEDDDGIVTVGDLAGHELIRTSRSTVSRRCSKLADNGLLRRVSEGVYVITDEGRGYIDEKYDVERGMWLENESIPNGTEGADIEEANGA